MPRRNPEDENDREFLRFYEFQKQIAAHRMAAEDCRRRARYDFEALLEAREHDAEAERLTEEYKAWSAARQAAEAAKARPGRPRRNPEFDAAAEARIGIVVGYFEALAVSKLAELEEPGSDLYEKYFDSFLMNLNARKEEIAVLAREILKKAEDDLATVDNETLVQAVGDPTIYDFELNSTGIEKSNVVYTREVLGAEVLDTATAAEIFSDLLRKGFSLPDLVEALRQLRQKEIELTFSASDGALRGSTLLRAFPDADDPEGERERRRFGVRALRRWKEAWPTPLLGAVHVVTSAGVGSLMEARISRIRLVDKLRSLIEEREKSSEPDEVVYRYAGTNDTVAGASARGFYVATLRPDQLKAEGAALGICVGREGMSYKPRLEAGEIQIFSIRTEAGESKFCIERLVRGESELNFETNEWERLFAPSDIAQIKGTANRLPGFEPAAFVLTKPDEVRLVVEFLQALGYKNEAIARMNDIGPGVETMVENGIDPFIPPLKRQRPVLSPEEREARKQAAMRRRGAAENPALVPSPQTAAMIQEDYAHPWGGRWGT